MTRENRTVESIPLHLSLALVKSVRRLFPLLLSLALPGIVFAQSDWDEPFPPHRIADRLYYVGSKGLASYLVTTSQGHILINSSFERTLPIIRSNIEQLGFKFTDIKILLGSHAHSDHVEGHGHIKELTKARVEVMRGDDQVIASGGKGQYLYREGWRPCSVDRVLKERQALECRDHRQPKREPRLSTHHEPRLP
ncbi:MAG: MBL fold metallo-hydrolase [Proteobacteria bacterium]|nr:MBL fold metallo-hydrolase [Pseudomonadota bacterium]